MIIIVDDFASEYGWTKDYIYYSIFPDEIEIFRKQMEKRIKEDYSMQLRIVTNPHLEQKHQRDLFKLLSSRDPEQEINLDIDSFKAFKNRLSSQSNIVVK